MERSITEKAEENQCLSPNIVYPTENRQMKQREREEVGCTPQPKKKVPGQNSYNRAPIVKLASFSPYSPHSSRFSKGYDHSMINA